MFWAIFGVLIAGIAIAIAVVLVKSNNLAKKISTHESRSSHKEDKQADHDDEDDKVIKPL